MYKKAIITGVTGQDGAYLSQFLLNKGYTVLGITRSKIDEKLKNLKYLNLLNHLEIKELNLTDLEKVNFLVRNFKPDEIYNLAAQSSVGKSFLKPYETIYFNNNSILNLLQAVVNVNFNVRFFQASSSEMFGCIGKLPVKENDLLNPISPYGISKAFGHFIVNIFRKSYKIFAASGILFNHESYLRGNDFFVKKVILQSLEISKGVRENLYVGNIDIKRDFGYTPDYIGAIWKMLQLEVPQDFIICSGKSISLREIIFYIFNKLNIDKSRLIIDKRLYREEDVLDIYGDNTRAKEILNWGYNKNFFQVLDILIEEEMNNFIV